MKEKKRSYFIFKTIQISSFPRFSPIALSPVFKALAPFKKHYL